MTDPPCQTPSVMPPPARTLSGGGVLDRAGRKLPRQSRPRGHQAVVRRESGRALAIRHSGDVLLSGASGAGCLLLPGVRCHSVEPGARVTRRRCEPIQRKRLTPDSDGCRREPCGTGKAFNSLCTTMLSTTAAVPSAPPLSPPWHKRSTLQYLPGGVLGVHFLDNALKNAVLVEDECSPERSQCGLTVHFLLSPRAEGLEHLRGGVRK